MQSGSLSLSSLNNKFSFPAIKSFEIVPNNPQYGEKGFDVGLNLKAITLNISRWLFCFSFSCSETCFFAAVKVPYILSFLYIALSQNLKSFLMKLKNFFPVLLNAAISKPFPLSTTIKQGSAEPN